MIERIKLNYWILLIVSSCCVSLHAGELGHYTPGVASIRDFVVPEPGFYYAQYNLLYTADRYNNRKGNKVSTINLGSQTITVDTDVSSFAIVPTFIWSTGKKILGANYAAYIAPAFVDTSVQAGLSTSTRFGLNIDDSNFGLGDLYVRPVWLGWNRPHTAVSIGYGLYLPTGEYEDGAVDNLGLGFYTHEFQASLAVFPWVHQGTAITLTGTYEIHHEKEGADITPGDRFSLEYGLSQYLPLDKNEKLLLELGVSGYSNWQVDHDSGDDVIQVLKVKDEVHGAGVQVGLAYLPWNGSITVRYMKEYDAEARFEGELITLTLAKGF